MKNQSMKTLFTSLLVLLFTSTLLAQNEESSYPQNYFRNPLNIPILLAGNFGECRPNHFHSGIDIKTEGRENMPVFAAADGYISRIKMDKGGFGHALYITHPNGYTTLYAHLNNFIPIVQQYLRKQQYARESWSIDLSLSPEQFPVKKGEQIAWSGNTGASTAPHLHFEIRNTITEHPLNGMLFGLPIKDTKPPIPYQLALYNMNQSIFQQTPKIINLKKEGNKYVTTPDTLLTTDLAGIALYANDFMDGSNNTLNFFTARWFLDDDLQGSIKLDNIGYDVTRYLHAYVDYRLHKQKGDWFQLLMRQPGNRLTPIYPQLNNQRGILSLNKDKVYRLRIELKDAAGNKTEIACFLKPQAAPQPLECNRTFRFDTPNSFENPNIQFTLTDKDLYDNICFSFRGIPDATAFSDKNQIQNADIPVHNYYDLRIKANKPIPFNLREKIVMVYSDGKKKEGRAAKFENGWYIAPVRNLGLFWLEADTTAPIIKSLQKENGNLSNARQLRFQVTEEQTSIKTFRGELDGKWLCFEPRGNIFFYDFDAHCSSGKHRLLLTATDENGNENKLEYNFIR